MPDAFDLDAALDAAVVEPDTDPPPDGDKPRTRRPRSDKGQPRTRRTATKKLADELLNPWAKLATAMAFPVPTVTAVMIERGEKTTVAFTNIASRYPKMLKALENVAQVGDAAEIGETALLMFVAMLMDVGRIPPEHPLGMVTGVTGLYQQVHPDMPQEDNGNGNVHPFPFAPPPPGMPNMGARV